MRKFKLSAVLAALLVTSAIAGAGVSGTLSVAGQLLANDVSSTIRPAASTHAFVDGRVPVRIQKVVDGKLVPATQAAVTFAHDGQTVSRLEEVKGGTVQAEGLGQGGYSVFIRSNEGFAAFATWVGVASAEDDVAGSMISVGMVPVSDMPTVRRLIRERLHPAEESPAAEQDFFTSTEADAQSSSNSLTHGSGLELSADGTLKGRIVRASHENGKSSPLEESRVYFVKQNAVVGEAVSDVQGLFSVGGLASGIYSLVVTQQNSFVAISVTVAPNSTTVAGHAVVNDISLVAFNNFSDVPEVCMCYEEDIIVCDENFDEVVDERVENEAVAGHGTSSGNTVGGSSGGSTGFDGAGSLLFGAALGAGIYAIADDDPRRVVSPPAP